MLFVLPKTFLISLPRTGKKEGKKEPEPTFSSNIAKELFLGGQRALYIKHVGGLPQTHTHTHTHTHKAQASTAD